MTDKTLEELKEEMDEAWAAYEDAYYKAEEAIDAYLKAKEDSNA